MVTFAGLQQGVAARHSRAEAASRWVASRTWLAPGSSGTKAPAMSTMPLSMNAG